jgi:hypothetical protein
MLRVTSRTLLALGALGLLAACGGDGKRLWNVDYGKGIEPLPSREEAIAARRPTVPGPAVDPVIAAEVAQSRRPVLPPPRWPWEPPPPTGR